MLKQFSLFQETHADDFERLFQEIGVLAFKVVENLIVSAQDTSGQQIPLL